MNKRFFIINLLLITNLTLHASSVPIRTRNQATRSPWTNQGVANDQLSATQLLDQIHQGYASQSNNEGKAGFINYILNNEDPNITVEQKIAQAQTLARVVAADISMRSGWIYNNPEEQPQIDWLKYQQTIISNKIAELQWQAKSFGEKTAWQTAKYASMYLGVILAAYLSQGQMSKITGTEYNASYGDLAWMPIESFLNFAKNAMITTKNVATGETAQKSAAMALALTKAAGEYGYAAGKTIATKGQARFATEAAEAQKAIHEATQSV